MGKAEIPRGSKRKKDTKKAKKMNSDRNCLKYKMGK